VASDRGDIDRELEAALAGWRASHDLEALRETLYALVGALAKRLERAYRRLVCVAACRGHSNESDASIDAV
jgi:hypothetical protein